MAFVSLRQVLDHAAEHDYGAPAFKVNNLEQIQAIMETTQETQSSVILQASAGARKYADEPYLRHMVLAAVEAHPDIPVVLHQNHGASPAVCQQSVRSGFSSVMMDGSLLEDAEIQRGIKYGVRKINIDTDIRLAMTGAMRQVFAEQPSEFDPRKAMVAAKKAARAVCKARFEAFGCAGHAARIKPIPLDAMAARYS
ncbi:MAG: class II fructose-bisphosphate aldolase [Dechloromonas sp.]|jgi:fructose/tagatose bisphosphate aldolase|uniref:class II fructose-bisphosphate aldolase n=1 Tax=Dechloromonas sp. CZR5 TaxID=2608630 RepID=UPI00123D12C8|nr:class II fructose-bisphosphate aldolase [Dechloromonas sp. CZR5]MBS4016966.1 class II fructose-bisphosphate aldolase [Dechloromonas sp.]